MRETMRDSPPSPRIVREEPPLRAVNTVAGVTRPRPTISVTSSEAVPTGIIPRPAYGLQRPSSIRIRRLPSTSALPTARSTAFDAASDGGDASNTGRRRSTSAPQAPNVEQLLASQPKPNQMTTVAEEQDTSLLQIPEEAAGTRTRRSGSIGSNRLRSASLTARNRIGNFIDGPAPTPATAAQRARAEYDRNIVDILDVVDPEVSTLNSLTNVQNSLFVPNLGRFLNRHPTYDLSRRPATIGEEILSEADEMKAISRVQTQARVPADKPLPDAPSTSEGEEIQENLKVPTGLSRIDSHMPEAKGQYAVLPHGISLASWSEEDKAELNDHVRHMLHSRRSKFKRRMKAFGKYVRKPLGFFVTLYAVLITLFGLAWVLFLIGWINVGGRKSYIINVIDNVLVALFAVVGDGLAPFRVVDTYHMCFIAHYHHLTWRLRRERDLPKLKDHNDLPEKRPTELDGEDVEDGVTNAEYTLLSAAQQKKLVHHQNKFSKSHSFYKPHETATHHAFPLRLLVAIVCLLDCHSIFQIALGACTWAISYHHRPGALTPTILCCSITVNITAGILITVGDRRTRKKDVVTRMLRQAMTEEALRKMEKDREKQMHDHGVVDGGHKGTNMLLLSHEDSRERDEHGRVKEVPGQGHALSRRA